MRKTHVRIYRDKRKEWRWRAIAANGKILADSGEGFKRRDRCEENLALTAFALTGPVELHGADGVTHQYACLAELRS